MLFVIIPIIFFVIFIIICVVCIKAFSKHSSNFKNLIDNDGVNSLKDVFNKVNDAVAGVTTTTCEYCGCKCEKNEDKCPNCGAPINNNKK